MRLAIGADHGGFDLKERLKVFLKKSGYEVEDFGINNPDSADYPRLAFNTAKSVAKGINQFGIFICGSGVGACIVANKVTGIRAALCYNPEIARLSREHNNANFLCLGGRFITENEAFEIVKIWLDTPFSGGRHARRVDQIGEIEKEFAKLKTRNT